ncbi:MAG: hypothetical protein KAT15_13670, partial [Bacteroidales bacterium]|nr:hypothetical protein [Bacteroidales bacterium]
PLENIPQFNNQVVDQEAPFFSYTKGFYGLPIRIRDQQELKALLANVQALVQASVTCMCGPVHLNVPMEEPLYEKLPAPVLSVDELPDHPETDEAVAEEVVDVAPDKKIMILAGMGSPNEEILAVLRELIRNRQTVVIAENIANKPSRKFISNPELILAGAGEGELKNLRPDVLITFGGQVVSRRLRQFLKSVEHLEVEVLQDNILPVLKGLQHSMIEKKTDSTNHYLECWIQVRQRVIPIAKSHLDNAPFSNLASVHRVLLALPEGCVLHLGNSAVIRYAQAIPVEKDLLCFANRGTSGIDGCVSAAVGAAMVSDDLHVLLVGDLSFVYDSNALWNKDFPENLKIVVLNDGGGGIFRLLDGPDRMGFFEEFSVTHHPVSLELLSQAFGRRFHRVFNLADLDEKLEILFQPETGISVLEVDTSGSENSRIFKDFLKLES